MNLIEMSSALVTTSPLFFPYRFNPPHNHVHWAQTPDAHIFSADPPCVRKEEIKVEVEVSRYLIIRTEAVEESREPARSFLRKFRLPNLADGISAGYEDGVLAVTVPRSITRSGFFIDPADLPGAVQVLARAA